MLAGVVSSTLVFFNSLMLLKTKLGTKNTKVVSQPVGLRTARALKNQVTSVK